MDTPQEEIKKAEAMQGGSAGSYKDSDFNPIKNPDTISIMRMDDGNYKLWGQRFGKVKEIRGIKPEDCLSMFLTSE